MNEIIVPYPKVNTEAQRAYSYGSWQDSTFRELAIHYDFTPENYPLAVDLFAGDGSWARRLVDNGWDPQNITCIDIARTETPLVQGVRWLHWDLRNLYTDILRGRELPPEVLQLKGASDAVFLFFGFLHNPEPVEDFFARDGALIWNEGMIRSK